MPISPGLRGTTTSGSVSILTFRIPGRVNISLPAAATSAAPAGSILPSRPPRVVPLPSEIVRHSEYQGTEYNSFASFLLGYSQDAGKIFQWPDYYYTNTKYFAGYARDQWQVTPKLTVNLGVRFDYFPVPVRNGTGAEYYDKPTNNMVICGVASTPNSCNIFDKNQSHFVPRHGSSVPAWGSHGYPGGLRHVNRSHQYFRPFQPPDQLPVYRGRDSASSERHGLCHHPPPGNQRAAEPIPPHYRSSAGAWHGWPVRFQSEHNFRRAYVETYNFTIEERIRPGWTASVAYAGSQQKDPMSSLEENWSPIGTGTAGLLLNLNTMQLITAHCQHAAARHSRGHQLQRSPGAYAGTL